MLDPSIRPACVRTWGVRSPGKAEMQFPPSNTAPKFAGSRSNVRDALSNLLDKCSPLRVRRIFHSVKSQPEPLGPWRDQPCQSTHQYLARRVAHIDTREPFGSTRRGDNAEHSDALQQRPNCLWSKIEGDARKPDPIEVALQNRGHPVPPRWKHEDN